MKIITLCCALTICTVGTARAAEIDTRVSAPACSSVFEPASGSYQFVQEQNIDYVIADNARVGEIYYTACLSSTKPIRVKIMPYFVGPTGFIYLAVKMLCRSRFLLPVAINTMKG